MATAESGIIALFVGRRRHSNQFLSAIPIPRPALWFQMKGIQVKSIQALMGVLIVDDHPLLRQAIRGNHRAPFPFVGGTGASSSQYHTARTRGGSDSGHRFSGFQRLNRVETV